MAEVYDWQDYIDKDGEFAPIEKPGEADAQDVPTAVHKNNNSETLLQAPENFPCLCMLHYIGVVCWVLITKDLYTKKLNQLQVVFI